MKTSVIICTRNRLADICAFLPSLAAQTRLPDELIIIDSSDTPLSTQEDFNLLFNTQNFPKTVLIYEHTQPGLTFQRNVGIDRATGDLIYFFDDDVILELDYLEEMNAFFAQHPDCVAAMGTITNTPALRRGLYRAMRILFLLPRDYASGNFTASGMPTFPYGTLELKQVEVVGGCCMAFRASVVRKHRFDEALIRYAYMEDVDIARRIASEGKIFFNPRARLEHRASPVARDAVEDNRAMFMRNYRYLFFKNFYPHNRLAILAHWWSVAGLFMQAILIRDWRGLKGYWRGLRQPLILELRGYTKQ